ncbi:Protein of unknown function [Lactobacillus acidophilus DSM 9126]|nr:Protein of unknown function [Lactobacillus acidophilus DSM 20079 = JCM 1132 = NBRC 13951 = CIP 76.13]CDF69458.1 Protein of unknown function [Lactobacillus acidophilus CIRM-BIA 442]CDF71215.1 Protein of unknown function [Lactobacillus acidophilus CIRM-BIA 445]CDF73043.1 Protein of unknown function [Lactobacillus acidophilus DSM 9126]CDF75033.1 Protein of unknown function [Lactobacillus acidophilus DSM 20242]
MDKDKAEK